MSILHDGGHDGVDVHSRAGLTKLYIYIFRSTCRYIYTHVYYFILYALTELRVCVRAWPLSLSSNWQLPTLYTH